MSLLSFLTLIDQNSAKVNFDDNSFYLFAGLDLGLSQLNSDVPQEASSKSGLVWGGKLLGNYNRGRLSLNIGLGYFDNTFESEVINNKKIRLTTSTLMLEINPMLRLANRHALGIVWNQFLGEDLLVGASGLTTSNTSQTKTSKMLGINYYYRFPWKKYRVRVGAQLMKPLSIGDRSGLIALFNAQIGFPLYKEQSSYSKASVHAPTPVVLKAKEAIKVVEPVKAKSRIADYRNAQKETSSRVSVTIKKKYLNFLSNRSELDQTSATFLSNLAVYLKENSDDWTHLAINGHTDKQGPAKYNMKLSIKRSAYVYNKLIEYGINPARLSYQGHGETKLIDLGNSKEAHSTNRRVEINFKGYTNAEVIQEFFKEYHRE